MCGIIGINAKTGNIIPEIVQALKNLEYRGYDSAGVAAIIQDKIVATKVEGKIANLEEAINNSKFANNLAIGHTRWATHGAANKTNAHPHHTKQVAVVHNGIIENYLELKEELIASGYEFFSQTDSEVIPNLITFYLNQGLEPLEAVQKAVERLVGAYSIAVLFVHYPNLLIVARHGSPLVIGYGEDKNIVASDAYALSFLTNKISYLEEGDLAVIYNDEICIVDKNNKKVQREIITIDQTLTNISKGNFSHYMLKEIFEQPSIIAGLINYYYDISNKTLNFGDINIDCNIPKITLVACGSSFFAALTSKYWLEKYAKIQVEVEIASEFRYRESFLPENGLCIFLSQSGETADTLAALRYAKSKKQKILSIVNAKESSIERESDYTLPCLAGPEISVASTKGLTSQLTILLFFTLCLSLKRNTMSLEEFRANLVYVSEIPGRIAEILNNAEQIKNISLSIVNAKSAIFIGRNYIFPIALEGALKLKELSYIHAEAIAAGELKHGPIALIDEDMPIIALAPQNHLFEKTFSNIQEILARGGKVISFSSKEGNKLIKSVASFDISSANEIIEPIIYAIPMQLIAYYVATKKGTDVDQPRNLAKSVTVE